LLSPEILPGRDRRREMDKDEKERLRQYGQLVCAFVNAKTITEACLKTTKALQDLFCFYPDFTENLRTLVATGISTLNAGLSKREKAVFKFMVKERLIKKSTGNIHHASSRYILGRKPRGGRWTRSRTQKEAIKRVHKKISQLSARGPGFSGWDQITSKRFKEIKSLANTYLMRWWAEEISVKARRFPLSSITTILPIIA
jgi:hypothetical protein